MMRLGRRAVLLVAFFLLASAATAYAECAWVICAIRSHYLKTQETIGSRSKPSILTESARAS